MMGKLGSLGLAVILTLMSPSAARAQDSAFYPSAGTVGTWAFEDNWPATGDFDINDLSSSTGCRSST